MKRLKYSSCLIYKIFKDWRQRMSILCNFFKSASYVCVFYYFMCISIPHACLVPSGQNRALDLLGLRVIDSYESSCGCWDSNLDPLEEAWELLTATSNLQSHTKHIKGKSKHIPRLCPPRYSSRDREEMTVSQVFLPTKEQKHTKG